LLGRSNWANAVLAAVTALCAGARPDAVAGTLAALPAPRRRMQIIHRGRFRIIDDTIGHPESVSALFETIELLPHRRLHIAFAVRGCRGTAINRETGRALAIWARRLPPATLAITTSEEAADARNRTSPAERDAFVEPLRRAGHAFALHPRLSDAITAVLENAGDGDLMLLLGAQSMDRGAGVARDWLRARGAA
jgi:UDP-N-acetylmuramoyl-L-alanyl-D-glutamate--2,6-diaminopimelate ligase